MGLVDFVSVCRIKDIPTALEAERRKTKVSPIDHDRLPVKLKTTVDRGAELWKALQKEKADGENKNIADCVAKLFAPGLKKEAD